MRKVLIINYHFPPDAAIGAVRYAKFAKYLPYFGWKPVVLTVEESCYERRDHATTATMAGDIAIYRVRPLPGLLEIYSRLRSGGNGELAATTLPVTEGNGQKERVTLKRLVGSMLRVPDDKQGWAVNVIKDGYRILRNEKIDVFVTSGPPMGTHAGGAVLKAMTGAKWIADFRDPWWGSTRRMEPQFRTEWSDSLTRKLESLVVRNADLVISTAPALTGYFRALLPPDKWGKCVTITNGFDEDDFSGLLREPETGKGTAIRICHAGSLYLGRNPEPFLDALRSLMERGDIDGKDISVEFIGASDYNGTPMAALVAKYGLGPIVRLTDAMPHRACLERLVNSDGLLLFAQDFAEQIPAKVFEYLRLDKPTLAVITDGDASAVLGTSPKVFMADPRVPGQLKEKLLEMLGAAKNKQDRQGTEAVLFSRYARRTLTEQLAGYLG